MFMCSKNRTETANDGSESRNPTNAADFANCTTIFSSVFQVAALCAKLADMEMEVKRGVEAWPRNRVQVG